jgi:[pyruvate, water dikinase]-phosphate phosphotransferase / [pyruvate, water dikinase] kinase
MAQICKPIENPYETGDKDASRMNRNYFHLHLVSDSTGETLLNVSRAATAQYQGISAIEHIYPLVRNRTQLDRVISEIEAAPGIVLYTLVDETLSYQLEEVCKEQSSPCLSILSPVLGLFQSYLGTASSARPGAQHTLNAEYFRRIDALNFTMLHDDGQLPDQVNEADVVLVGVSRTSKTPTAIYLANRGIKTANVPLVPGVLLPARLQEEGLSPLIVGLIATPERIVQIRQNRLLSLNAEPSSDYVDKDAVTEEVAQSRRLFTRQGWPVIDVTRRSIEETAAAIIELNRTHRMSRIAQS